MLMNDGQRFPLGYGNLLLDLVVKVLVCSKNILFIQYPYV